MKTCGIYQIKNTVTGKRYVGSSADIETRWTTHRCHLRKGVHHSRKLQNSWNKHGEENFSFEVLEVCPKDDLVGREQFYIDLESHYNILPRAASMLGLRYTDEAKARRSAQLMGHKHSDETKEKLRQKSLDQSQAISVRMKGRVLSDGTKEKIGSREVTSQMRDKWSVAAKKQSAEISKRMSFKRSEEQRANMSNGWKKRKALGLKSVRQPMSEATKALIGQKAKERAALRRQASV